MSIILAHTGCSAVAAGTLPLCMKRWRAYVEAHCCYQAACSVRFLQVTMGMPVSCWKGIKSAGHPEQTPPTRPDWKGACMAAAMVLQMTTLRNVQQLLMLILSRLLPAVLHL